jgi:hypothetical protein
VVTLHVSRPSSTLGLSSLISTTATCFFLGILFASFPYDYNVLWTTPAAIACSDPAGSCSGDAREPYYALLEAHLKFVHASPPLIPRILHIAIGTGLLGFLMKLYKPSEANMLFDGASLAMYLCAITVYMSNIVKGLRLVSSGYGGETTWGHDELVGREDSLKILAASNTILALVLVGVLVLQAGQWYAQRREEAEIQEMDRARDEKRRKRG